MLMPNSPRPPSGMARSLCSPVGIFVPPHILHPIITLSSNGTLRAVTRLLLQLSDLSTFQLLAHPCQFSTVDYRLLLFSTTSRLRSCISCSNRILAHGSLAQNAAYPLFSPSDLRFSARLILTSGLFGSPAFGSIAINGRLLTVDFSCFQQPPGFVPRSFCFSSFFLCR